MRSPNHIALKEANMTNTTLAAFPNCSNDTPSFQLALAEFREYNPHFADREFWDLPLDDRCAILRVAQLKKNEAQLTDREISDAVFQ